MAVVRLRVDTRLRDEWASKAAEFISDAWLTIAKDELKFIASTDIAAYPAMEHIQGCMVRTQQTGAVAFMLHDEASGPDGPVADAVSALMKSMFKPEKSRH